MTNNFATQPLPDFSVGKFVSAVRLERKRANGRLPRTDTFSLFIGRFGQSTIMLGEVRWYPHWRRYCFYPRAETIYDPICMNDIASFCLERTNERKAQWKRNGRKPSE